MMSYCCVSSIKSEIPNNLVIDLMSRSKTSTFVSHKLPQCEFGKSSEVFADMFLLHSGPAMRSEGQDGDHPFVLEGYKKDDFTSLLKVMYLRYVQ